MFTVRECNKTGGSQYTTLRAAYKAAWLWFQATGIACSVIDPNGNVLYTVEAV